MISLKNYLESNPDKLLQLGMESYCAVLDGIADSGARCCPSTSLLLQRELSNAAEALKRDPTPETLRCTKQLVLKSLRSWGEQSETYFKRKAGEVKEIFSVLAGTADFLGKRDQRYIRQVGEIAANLQGVARLEDLSRVRAALMRNAGELRGCVERMAKETSDQLAQLQTTLAAHRVELDQARALASLDPLTGLSNRREVEARIAQRVADCTPFCAVIIDLNNFKQINDRHGHLAGDELLRQIAAELRQACRAEDVVGRWGGDEFILILDGSFTSTKVKVERMRPWVFGNYDLELGGEPLSVFVRASIGMAEWAPGETILQVLSRADSEMYREKKTGR